MSASAAIAPDQKPHSIKLVAAASLIGTTIEWYDFFLYNTAAALIFPRLFFPSFEPLTGTLLSFATYTVGFIARPLGGIVMGHFGDRLGRKSMLVLTLIIMGLATTLIGLVPTYAQIGVWAPVSLVVLRIVQGFGVGGEWGGAVLMAVEHAPPGRRGFYGSWPQIGVPAGLALSIAVFRLFSGSLPEDQFITWGWRIPFVLSVLLVFVGLLIRVRILETPAFTKVKESGKEARMPIIEVLRTHPREVLLAAGARMAENASFYIYSVFVLVYATNRLKLTRDNVLTAVLAASLLEIVAVPLFGALSDRLGRRPVYLFGAIVTAVFAYPLFWMFDTRSVPMIYAALIIAFVFSHAAMYGPQAAFLSELFGARVRYSGASLGAQISAVAAGGAAPLIATEILRRGYGRGALALYIIAMALITIASVIAAAETHQRDVEY